jgi:citrate lyase subunit alpha/citrate CoA-transferase
MTGKPDPLRVEEKITCIVEYRDGTVLDVIRQLSEK